jgi:hypothetical protein
MRGHHSPVRPVIVSACGINSPLSKPGARAYVFFRVLAAAP